MKNRRKIAMNRVLKKQLIWKIVLKIKGSLQEIREAASRELSSRNQQRWQTLLPIIIVKGVVFKRMNSNNSNM